MFDISNLKAALADRKKAEDASSSQNEASGENTSLTSSHSANGLNGIGSIPPRNKTNYCGLNNQGATCYLNSLLQAMYCTQELKEEIFNWKF